MQKQITNININANVLPCEHRLVFALLLLASSFVIADTTLKLDFPDEFYLQSTDTKFSRDNQYHIDKTDPRWRKSTRTPSPTVRWGAKSIYEENSHLDPFFDTQGSDQATETIRLNPQLEIRY